MPTPTTYLYSLQNDFPNHAVAPDRLAYEIQISSIAVALTGIDEAGDTVSISFADVLSVNDKTTLDGVVAAHQGVEFPALQSNASATTADASPTALASFDLPDQSAYLAQAIVTARDRSGQGRGGFGKAALVFRQGAGATMQGVVQNLFADITSAPYTVTWIVTGNTLVLSVTGLAASTVDWQATIALQPILA